jgi:hypothetical protein
LFADPDAPQRVRRELDDASRDAGHATIDDAFCVAHDTVASSVN